MAEGSTLGLLFEISADPSKAIAATDQWRGQATSALKEFEEQMLHTMQHNLGITKEFAIGMTTAIGAIAGVSYAVFELADRSAELGAKMYEASEKFGFSVENLSGLNALAKETGESFDGLSMALSRATVNLTKGIANPAEGTGKVLAKLMGGAKELTELGLKPMEDRIQEVLHRIFELNDIGERNRALQTLMGRGWMQNVEVLELLAEHGYGPAIEQAKKFGMFFDEEAARKAKQFRVEWEQTKATLEGVSLTLGKQLLPAVNAVIRNISVEIEYIKQYGLVFDQIAKGQVASAAIAAIAIGTHGKSILQIMTEQQKMLDEIVKKHDKSEGGDPHDAETKLSEKKRLLDLQMEASLKAADQELQLNETVNKELFASQAAAIEKWYQLQADAMVKALEGTRKLFGAQSSEYKSLVNKMTELDQELLLKLAQLEEKVVTEFSKAAKESEEEFKKRQTAFVQETGQAQQAINEAMRAEATRTVQVIIARSKERIANQKAVTEDEFKLEEALLNRKLQQHRITGAQFDTLQKGLLARRYQTEVTALQRELEAKKAAYGVDSAEYEKLIHEKQALDRAYELQKVQSNFHIDASNQEMVTSFESMLGAIGGAMRKHHAVEIALIAVRAAIKVTENIAKSIEAFADLQPHRGIMYAAAAAEHAIVAGAQAAGVGSSGSGSGGGSSANSSQTPNPNYNPQLAPGAAGANGGTYHIVVMGDAEGSQHIAGLIDNAVRFQGVQLTSSHSLRPST